MDAMNLLLILIQAQIMSPAHLLESDAEYREPLHIFIL